MVCRGLLISAPSCSPRSNLSGADLLDQRNPLWSLMLSQGTEKRKEKKRFPVIHVNVCLTKEFCQIVRHLCGYSLTVHKLHAASASCFSPYQSILTPGCVSENRVRWSPHVNKQIYLLTCVIRFRKGQFGPVQGILIRIWFVTTLFTHFWRVNTKYLKGTRL